MKGQGYEVGHLFEPGDHHEYISDLTRCSLQRLEREPQELKAERENLTSQIEDLEVKNYGVFLKTASVAEETLNSIRRISSKTEVLEQTLPSLIKSCNRFSSQASEIARKRSITRLITDNQSKILEILELPLLMRRCVQNRMFQEALDISEFGQSLSQRLFAQADLPVLQSIVQEMEKISEDLTADLLKKLEEKITLPACLRVVGFLRRLGKFEPEEVRREFLKRRSVWFQTVAPEIAQERLSRLESSEAFDYLDSYMKEARTGSFDILTHYRGIFIGQDVEDEQSGGKSLYHNDDDLLRTWAHEHIHRIIVTINRVVPYLNTGAQLLSALESAMYCGQSLGRVGIDFRGLVVPTFERRTLSLLAEYLQNALEEFSSAYESHDWHIAANVLAELGLHNEDDDTYTNNKRGKSEPATPGESETPQTASPSKPDNRVRAPMKILELPPLAVFTNGLVKALHNYSQCCACWDYEMAAERFCLCLEKAAEIIHNNKPSASDSVSADPNVQIAALQKLAQGLIEDLVPFLRHALRAIFPCSIPEPERLRELADRLESMLPGLYPPPRALDEEDSEDEIEFGLNTYPKENNHQLSEGKTEDTNKVDEKPGSTDKVDEKPDSTDQALEDPDKGEEKSEPDSLNF